MPGEPRSISVFTDSSTNRAAAIAEALRTAKTAGTQLRLLFPLLHD